MNKRKILGYAKRLGLLILVVWTVVSLVTLIIELVPGDPALAILGDQATPEQVAVFRAKHGLDKPAFFFSYNGENGFEWHGVNNRYVKYWKGLLTLDLGNSFRTDRPVLGMIMERYPATIKLAVAALIIAVFIAVPLGVVAGTNKNTLIDNFASFFALLGICLPGFVIGPLLVYIFAVKLPLVFADRKLLPGRYSASGNHARRGTFGDFDANDPFERHRRTRRRLRPHGAGKRSERTGCHLQARFEKWSYSGRDDSRFAIGRFARRSDYHGKDFQLAGFRVAPARRHQHARSPARAGLCSGNFSHLYFGKFNNRPDLPAARSANSTFLTFR